MNGEPRVALLVITDGRRHCLERTLASVEEMVDGPVTQRVIVDDSADGGYARWLDVTYGDRYRIHHHARRMGFCATWRDAHSLAAPDCDWLMMQEDDFVYPRPIDLRAMIDVLDNRPHLAQMILVRQPWNAEEQAAGHILKVGDRASRLRHFEAGPCRWMEGRLFASTNPGLTRRAALGSWDTLPECEGRWGIDLLTNGFADVAGADVAFGYWGSIDDEPWVRHIGDVRQGEGY